MGSASHSPSSNAGRETSMPPAGADQASADDAHQNGALERNVGGVEVADPAAHQDAQRDRDADDQDEFDLLAQGALFAEEQDAETAGAHQHAADRRGNAEANQDGDENELGIQNLAYARGARDWHRDWPYRYRCLRSLSAERLVRRRRHRELHLVPCRDCRRHECPASARVSS